jgi:anhydro-N-acetylmuramic acid kinase
MRRLTAYLPPRGDLMSRTGRSGDERLIVGLMSGSSLDGIDAALVATSGCCDDLTFRLEAFECVPFDSATRAELLGLYEYATATVDKVCIANAVLADLFADAIRKVVAAGQGSLPDVDLIGVWPQMVYHLPTRTNPFSWRGQNRGACLQLGDISAIAERTAITTVGGFCARDIAAGGNGAPLTGFGDFAVFHRPGTGRVIQNIGGIANANFIPRDARRSDVVGFDTGPGNMVIDAVVSVVTEGKHHYDPDGRMAARGTVDNEFLTALLDNPFIAKEPPKAAGREDFGADYLRRILAEAEARDVRGDDLIATVTALTVESIVSSYERFFAPWGEIDEVIVGGGGARNLTLLGLLRDRLQCSVMTDDELGVPSFAKEALYMALLANETVRGHANNFPSVTGADHDVVMGLVALGKGWSCSHGS